MTEIVVKRMIEHFGADVRRINHALKVHGFAGCIARSEKLSEEEVLIIGIAAILHDVGIKVAEEKYNSSNGHLQEIEGPPVARQLLSGLPLTGEQIDRICFIIGNHHSYTQIDGIDFRIVVEADFLVNIDEDEIAKDTLTIIRTRYFRTETGLALMESIYLT